MFRAGQQIGIYTLVNRIGRGGFGEVWVAELNTKSSPIKVAVKLPLDDQIDRAAIEQEARLWAQASGHPNLLPTIEVNDYDGQIVIASEYAPDGSLDNLFRGKSSLADVLKAKGDLITLRTEKNNRGEDIEQCRLSVEKAVEIAIGVLKGLEFLHLTQIIHRDLKPSNILLQGYTPRLADFGISRLMRSSDSLTPHIAGTPGYMAPEALNGIHNAQTDIWSIGVLLYRMLTGNLPFPQADHGELLRAIIRDKPVPLPETIPAALQKIVLRALSKDVAGRYQTARDMREELQRSFQPYPKTDSTSIVAEEEERLDQDDNGLDVELPEYTKQDGAPYSIPWGKGRLISGLLLPVLIIFGVGAFFLTRDQSVSVTAGTMRILFILIAAWILTVFIHVFSMAVAGALVGGSIYEVSIFLGPKIFSFKRGDFVFSIRALPFGGFVKFTDGFQELHPFKRIFAASSGVLALMFFASLAFGLSDGFQKSFDGLYQIINGAYSPRAQGSQYLAALYGFVKTNPFWICVGLVASKVAAFNLLPLPTLNGGTIIMSLMEWILRVTLNIELPTRVKERNFQFGFFATLLVYGLWAAAFYFSLQHL